MLKIENTEVLGWDAAIRGMRNPLNSWEKSDSQFVRDSDYGCFGVCPCAELVQPIADFLMSQNFFVHCDPPQSFIGDRPSRVR